MRINQLVPCLLLALSVAAGCTPTASDDDGGAGAGDDGTGDETGDGADGSGDAGTGTGTGIGGTGCGSGGTGGSGDSGGAGTGGGSGGTGGGTGGGCSVALSPVEPQPGQTDFFYRDSLRVDVVGGDGTERLELATSAGVAVAGVQTLDGDLLEFTPDAPLTPLSDYVATVSFCDVESADYAFATSALGTPTNGCDVTASTYIVDLATTRFVAPAGLGSLLVSYFESHLMFQASSVSSSAMTWLGSSGESGVQDECVETTEFSSVTWADPYFELGPATANTNFVVDGVTVPIEDLTFSATFASDCSSYRGGRMTGTLDGRAEDLLALVYMSDGDEFCTFLTTLGVSCEPCASDGEPYCVGLDVRDISGLDNATSLVAVTAADIGDNPDCE